MKIKYLYRFVCGGYIALSLMGCTVGPNYVEPEITANDGWIDLESKQIIAEQYQSSWWQSFEDPLLEALIKEALNENLTLQIAAIRIVEARATLGISRNLRFPQQQTLGGQVAKVGLSGKGANLALADAHFTDSNFGFDASWELDVWGRYQRGIASGNAKSSDLFDSNSFRYAVGPGFSWSIFNYGRIHNNVRIQDARFQQAALNYQNTVLQSAREIENALTEFLHNQQRAVLLEPSLINAATSVKLAVVQYRQGSVNYQRVLDTQRFLVWQQDVFTTIRGDIALSIIAAYKALGGGWQTQLGRRILPKEIEDEMRQRNDWNEALHFIRAGAQTVKEEAQ